MGAGCYYTHDEIDARAFWVEIEYYYDDEETSKLLFDEYAWDDTIDNLKDDLISIGYIQQNEMCFYNGLYNLKLESGHGGECIIKLEPRGAYSSYTEDIRLFNLATANHDKCYNKLAKELINIGYKLRIATSGYTSTELNF